MIQRLNVSTILPRLSSGWPEASSGDERVLFAGRPPLRNLAVMVDADCLPGEAVVSTLTPGALLRGMLTHPFIKVQRYADGGPPADAERRALGQHSTLSAVEGWVELLPGSPDGSVVRHLMYVDVAGTPMYGGISGNRTQYAGADNSTSCYADLECSEARARREADALAVQAAEAVGADLFITTRPYLFAAKASYGHGVTVCTPKDAVALISLYLRTQGIYEFYREPGFALTTGEGGFFLVGTRELLPEGWRWYSGCGKEAVAVQDETLTYLGASLFQRVQRALRARDDVHRALNVPQNNYTAEDALTMLDVVLVMLMGAVDVSARVTHLLLGLSGQAKRAGWHLPDWRAKFEDELPDLAATLALGGANAQVLDILKALRNLIHGEALQPLGVGLGGSRTDTLLELPREDVTALLAGIGALGGRDAWGVRQVLPNQVHVDPGVLMEQILSRVIDMLNEIMRETSATVFQHAALTPADALPPQEEHGIFSERNRLSVRWQLGF